MPLSLNRLKELTEAFASQKILVVGDLMLDEFIWGKVSRISPEAPVPVVDVQRSEFYPGGAANVVRNLCAFTQHASMAGVIGKDNAGQKILSLLKKEGASVKAVLQSTTRPTTLKTRIIARQQQVVRVDRETKEKLSAADHKWLLTQVSKLISTHDAVIVEDYAKGLVDQQLVAHIIKEARRRKKIVAIDPNPNNLLDFSGATAIKPNRSEAFQMAGLNLEDGNPALMKAAITLQNKWAPQYLMITLSEEGVLLLEKGRPPYYTPTRARQVYDVSGAGDTSIALFTLALAAGATGDEATDLANHAAGVVVGKLGTATLTLEELRASFNS
jgi:D-glycero-beta-D-manno-heptose-7-phosphate kinase